MKPMSHQKVAIVTKLDSVGRNEMIVTRFFKGPVRARQEKCGMCDTCDAKN